MQHSRSILTCRAILVLLLPLVRVQLYLIQPNKIQRKKLLWSWIKWRWWQDKLILWSKKFIEYQSFKVKVNVIYQDNTSTTKLGQNGKASSGKRTMHFEIQLSYVTDLIQEDECMVKYCPIDDMIADYNTKPLVWNNFKVFRDLIMHLLSIIPRVCQQECVGHN